MKQFEQRIMEENYDTMELRDGDTFVEIFSNKITKYIEQFAKEVIVHYHKDQNSSPGLQRV